jgi:hypothetical protein
VRIMSKRLMASGYTLANIDPPANYVFLLRE